MPYNILGFDPKKCIFNLSQIKLCRDSVLFEEHFCQNFTDEIYAQKHFNGPGVKVSQTFLWIDLISTKRKLSFGQH